VAFAQSPQTKEQIDTAIVSKLKKEGMDNSRVMEVLEKITDVYGPRLTNSPGYKTAADYARKTLSGWGLENVHYDVWDEPFGRGWQLKKFNLQVSEPTVFPVIAYPKAWSPGIKGTVRAEAIHLDIKSEEDLKKYSGKLKGKIVLFSLPNLVKPAYTPGATRLTDSVLLLLANAPAVESYSGRRYPSISEPQRLAYAKWSFCQKEGAVAVIETSPGAVAKDGTLMASAASVPYPVDVPYSSRLSAYRQNAPTLTSLQKFRERISKTKL
jgi:hypothetical protein